MLVEHGKGSVQVTKDHRESKRNKHACTKATEKRKLEVNHSNLRFPQVTMEHEVS